MQVAHPGSTVTILFEGKLESGEVFDQATEEKPLSFTIGEQVVLPALEQAVIGMKIGDEKMIRLEPEEAYGEWREELTHTVDRQVFGDRIEPQPGQILGLTVEKEGERHQVPALVTKVERDRVEVDFNHPLAGKTLVYRIVLKDIMTGQPT